MNTCLKILLIVVQVVAASFWIAIPTQAADRSLVVKRTVHLKKKDSPFVFSSISVLSGGTLIIEPGVAVTLLQGATIYIAGKLEAKGSAQEPIQFTNNQEQDWDSFIISSEAQSAEISHVTFTNFKQPLQFYNRQTLLQDIKLIDGDSNLIVMGKSGNLYPSLLVKNVTIITQKKSSKRPAGIEFTGIFQNIRVQNLTIKDGHAFEDQDFRTIHISIEGPHQVIEVSNFLTPYRCPLKVETVVAHNKFFASPNPLECKPKILPVVFVPGYGTSINLSQLSRYVTADPNLNGWGFSALLTAAYGDFFKNLTNNGIPYEIAYYDWRLPANEAFASYVKPVIERTKQKYNVETVVIAAHSFGGIVSRTYIQGDTYEGDVARLIEIGTPNQGAAKSYSVWEAGILPKDWSFLNNLLRYYAYKFHNNGQPVSLIREFFPSAKELLPIYPAIFQRGEVVSPYEWYQKNTTLLQLRDTIDSLWKRTSVAVVGSNTEKTAEKIDVGITRGKRVRWPDGESIEKEPLLNGFGDGTVPIQSLLMSGATSIATSGAHADLPRSAAEQIIKWLYPRLNYKKLPSSLFHRQGLSFIFDCPIEVEITSPSGTILSSEKPESKNGEVFSSDELLWMILPKEIGTYTITIKAKEDTPVRWWMEDGEIHSLVLKKNQIITNYSTVNKESIVQTQSSPVVVSEVPILNATAPQLDPSIPQSVPEFLTVIPQVPNLLFSTNEFQFPLVVFLDVYQETNKSAAEKKYPSSSFTTINRSTVKKKNIGILVIILIIVMLLIIIKKTRK